MEKMVDLFVTALGGSVFPLGKVGVAVNEPVVRQGPGTIATKGIIFCVVSFSNTKGMYL
jgi:hypothetical protein